VARTALENFSSTYDIRRRAHRADARGNADGNDGTTLQIARRGKRGGGSARKPARCTQPPAHRACDWSRFIGWNHMIGPKVSRVAILVQAFSRFLGFHLTALNECMQPQRQPSSRPSTPPAGHVSWSCAPVLRAQCSLPRAERAVGDRQYGPHIEPAPVQIEQQLAPILSRFHARSR
jgi:hypothetical protein